MKYLLVFCLLFAGCINQTVISDEDSLKYVLDYKNGVYYFPYIEKNFARSLSNFKEKNPELKIISMCGDGNGVYGRDSGYFVVVEKQ